ncbi:4'-phosphopantetheinyl transferase family protein [Lacrimispora sp. JR3]|uniref:4'-phosphopantetheinyl transferase family protein n=1 Tax=Lacrimispora sinapis TaxID=3111456 RepID=UPI0037491CA8
MIEIYLARAEVPEGMKKYQWEHELGKKLLFLGLKEQYGIEAPAEQIRFGTGTYGKPYLKDFPHIHYNISHTDGMAVCGFSHRELGVDVERIRDYKDNVLRKVMSESEKDGMRELSEKERGEYFFRIWTLKESYGKAVGTGIVMPMSDITFTLSDIGNPGCSVPGVSFFQKLLEDGVVLSVCQKGNEKVNVTLNPVF